MEFTTSDLDTFLNEVYEEGFSTNSGGMGPPDMFTLWLALSRLKPDYVIESGVWNGMSTKLIRKTVGPQCKILCLDPLSIPATGFKDSNPNTVYLTGALFKDFGSLPLSKSWSMDKVFVFFDCHRDAALRLLQCERKGLKHLFFNDNYPVGCGAHYTIEHLRGDDKRWAKLSLSDRNKALRVILTYHVFPNIFPGLIKTGEGLFNCKSHFKEAVFDSQYDIFRRDSQTYRWNTYIRLK